MTALFYTLVFLIIIIIEQAISRFTRFTNSDWQRWAIQLPLIALSIGLLHELLGPLS